MSAFVANEELTRQLNFLPGCGIEPGQGTDQIGVPVIVGDVRVVVTHAVVKPGAGLEGEL